MKNYTVLRYLAFIIPAGFLFSLGSCVKDYFDMEKVADSKWTPQIALPMVYSSLTINDIIKASNSEDLFQIGTDNFVTLVYKGNLFSLKADEIISIPDNSMQQSFNVTTVDILPVPFGATYITDSTQLLNFNTGDSTKIDSLVYKSGTLRFSINSTLQHNFKILLSIPAAKKSGIAFSQTINVNYTDPMPVVSTADLSGYTFDMTLGGTSRNQFYVSGQVTVTGIAGNPLYTTDYVSVSADFKDTRFDKIFGYIGQQLLSPDLDTVHIGLFDNSAQLGKFTLVDAKIKVIISNSYGVPILANFNVLKGYNPPDQVFSITGSPNPLPLPSPTLAQIGQILVDSFELHKTNSNVVQLIEFQPRYVVYQLNSLSNPNGQVQNFVLDTSYFRVDMEIEMPLHGTAVVFAVQDTFEFEFPTEDELESLLLRINVKNGFPMDVGLQIYFADSSMTGNTVTYTILDSAIAPLQNILNSAPIDASGKAIGATEKTIDQWFDTKKLKNISNASHIFVKGQMTTAENGKDPVKIYSDYKLDVKIGAMAKLKQTISLH